VADLAIGFVDDAITAVGAQFAVAGATIVLTGVAIVAFVTPLEPRLNLAITAVRRVHAPWGARVSAVVGVGGDVDAIVASFRSADEAVPAELARAAFHTRAIRRVLDGYVVSSVVADFSSLDHAVAADRGAGGARRQEALQ